MVRRRVVGKPTPFLLGLWLAASVARAQAGPAALPPGPEHGSPPAQAQPLPDFRASTVVLTERKNGHTTRRTEARAARLCGVEIVADDVVMQVLSSNDGTVGWTLQTPSARLSAHEDRARFGPLRLVGHDGEQWRAEGGCWDGAQRRLSLTGPACGGRGGHTVCAQSAELMFAADSSEVACIALIGHVEGSVRAPGQGR